MERRGHQRGVSGQVRHSVSLREHGTSSTGLRLSQGMAFDTWGRRRPTARANVPWISLVAGRLVDLRRAHLQYGQRYTTALEVTDLDYQTLRNYAWVARSIPLSRRRDTLSFQHHAEVASLPAPAQDLWLQRAERSQWSRNDLRRRLAGARPRDRPEVEAPSVLLRMKVSPDRERRWRQAATSADQDLVGWMAPILDDAARVALEIPREAPGHEVRKNGGPVVLSS